MDTLMQVLKLDFQVLTILLPRHSIDSRGGVALEREVRCPQPINVYVMQ